MFNGTDSDPDEFDDDPSNHVLAQIMRQMARDPRQPAPLPGGAPLIFQHGQLQQQHGDFGAAMGMLAGGRLFSPSNLLASQGAVPFPQMAAPYEDAVARVLRESEAEARESEEEMIRRATEASQQASSLPPSSSSPNGNSDLSLDLPQVLSGSEEDDDELLARAIADSLATASPSSSNPISSLSLTASSASPPPSATSPPGPLSLISASDGRPLKSLALRAASRVGLTSAPPSTQLAPLPFLNMPHLPPFPAPIAPSSKPAPIPTAMPLRAPPMLSELAHDSEDALLQMALRLSRGEALQESRPAPIPLRQPVPDSAQSLLQEANRSIIDEQNREHRLAMAADIGRKEAARAIEEARQQREDVLAMVSAAALDPEPPSDSDSCTIAVRLPDSSRITRSWRPDTPFRQVLLWVSAQLISSGNKYLPSEISLYTAPPARRLLDPAASLSDLQLGSRILLSVDLRSD
ncbi:MAG: UBX domain-containing protein [archaeon]|nr:UBX domain-containing protein [archaeon]